MNAKYIIVYVIAPISVLVVRCIEEEWYEYESCTKFAFIAQQYLERQSIPQLNIISALHSGRLYLLWTYF